MRNPRNFNNPCNQLVFGCAAVLLVFTIAACAERKPTLKSGQSSQVAAKANSSGQATPAAGTPTSSSTQPTSNTASASSDSATNQSKPAKLDCAARLSEAASLTTTANDDISKASTMTFTQRHDTADKIRSLAAAFVKKYAGLACNQPSADNLVSDLSDKASDLENYTADN